MRRELEVRRDRAVRRRILKVITVIACLMLAMPVGSASAGPHLLPEPYSFQSGISVELAHPGGSLPGTNDFTCKPTAAHPRPVILVHGTGGSRQTNWERTHPC